MSDITKLPDLFRRRYLPNTTMRSVAETLATEVEAAMPVGTIITEDESTWPDEGQEIIFRHLKCNGKWSVPNVIVWQQAYNMIAPTSSKPYWNAAQDITCIWWPTNGMFEPPEDK